MHMFNMNELFVLQIDAAKVGPFRFVCVWHVLCTCLLALCVPTWCVHVCACVGVQTRVLFRLCKYVQDALALRRERLFFPPRAGLQRQACNGLPEP